MKRGKFLYYVQDYVCGVEDSLSVVGKNCGYKAALIGFKNSPTCSISKQCGITVFDVASEDGV
jgi:predicted secreted protein